MPINLPKIPGVGGFLGNLTGLTKEREDTNAAVAQFDEGGQLYTLAQRIPGLADQVKREAAGVLNVNQHNSVQSTVNSLLAQESAYQAQAAAKAAELAQKKQTVGITTKAVEDGYSGLVRATPGYNNPESTTREELELQPYTSALAAVKELQNTDPDAAAALLKDVTSGFDKVFGERRSFLVKRGDELNREYTIQQNGYRDAKREYLSTLDDYNYYRSKGMPVPDSVLGKMQDLAGSGPVANRAAGEQNASGELLDAAGTALTIGGAAARTKGRNLYMIGTGVAAQVAGNIIKSSNAPSPEELEAQKQQYATDLAGQLQRHSNQLDRYYGLDSAELKKRAEAQGFVFSNEGRLESIPLRQVDAATQRTATVASAYNPPAPAVVPSDGLADEPGGVAAGTIVGGTVGAIAGASAELGKASLRGATVRGGFETAQELNQMGNSAAAAEQAASTKAFEQASKRGVTQVVGEVAGTAARGAARGGVWGLLTDLTGSVDPEVSLRGTATQQARAQAEGVDFDAVKRGINPFTGEALPAGAEIDPEELKDSFITATAENLANELRARRAARDQKQKTDLQKRMN